MWTSFDELVSLAHDMAGLPHAPASEALPQGLMELNYDEYLRVNYRHDHATFRPAPTQIQYYHRGNIYPDRVDVHIVQQNEARDSEARHIAYDPDDFVFWHVPVGDDPDFPDLGFAGLKLVRSWEGLPTAPDGSGESETLPELGSFLGASYFRLLGEHSMYGASARGMTINSCLPYVTEYFPRFSAFALYPQPDAPTMPPIMEALLEGETHTGAFRFTITPGPVTRCDTQVHLFPRRGHDGEGEAPQIHTVGIAPITSMFLYRRQDDPDQPLHSFRAFVPEVHDSDHMLVQYADGSWLSRPLTNPPFQRLCGMPVQEETGGIKGFGLLQRQRTPLRYNNDPARYERRPDVWVELGEDFPAGRPILAELPSDREGYDNINCFWQLDEPSLNPDDGLSFTYSLYFGDGDAPWTPPLGRVVEVRAQPLGNSLAWDVKVQGMPAAPDHVKATVQNIEGGRDDLPEIPINIVGCTDPGQVIVQTGTPWDPERHLCLELYRQGQLVSERWTSPCHPM